MCDCNLSRNAEFCCVYGIRCKVTGRIYIGSTCNLEKRIKNHFRELKSGFKHITSKKRDPKREHPFQIDFNNYGIESFEVFVLEQNIPKCMRDEKEEYWIDRYHSTNSKYGYNLYKHCNTGQIRYETTIPVPVYIGLPPMFEAWCDYEQEQT